MMCWPKHKSPFKKSTSVLLKTADKYATKENIFKPRIQPQYKAT